MTNTHLLQLIIKAATEKHFEEFLLSGKGEEVFVDIEVAVSQAWAALGQSDTYISVSSDVDLNHAFISTIATVHYGDGSGTISQLTSRKLPDGFWSHEVVV